mmetsp:Transcript_5769/g.13154  ORF Transcript_5769/g.13154 Transcript_5769/m.13154 type:complete len:211 (-) Transcript_5769:1400-2032(-)
MAVRLGRRCPEGVVHHGIRQEAGGERADLCDRHNLQQDLAAALGELCGHTGGVGVLPAAEFRRLVGRVYLGDCSREPVAGQVGQEHGVAEDVILVHHAVQHVGTERHIHEQVACPRVHVLELGLPEAADLAPQAELSFDVRASHRVYVPDRAPEHHLDRRQAVRIYGVGLAPLTRQQCVLASRVRIVTAARLAGVDPWRRCRSCRGNGGG